MPKIGEIRHGWELGCEGSSRSSYYRKQIWASCLDCGKERWIGVKHGKPISPRCNPCCHKRGENNPNWKGGWYLDRYGYRITRLQPDDFFYPMTDGRGYIREHRLVMAKLLKRCLLPWEIVHHRGTKYASGSIEDKGDNRIENLLLLPSHKYHIIDTIVKRRLRQLERMVESRDKQIKELKCQLEKEYGENICSNY